MIENSNVFQEINSIATAIQNKSKRTFKYQKKNLDIQAMSFSPIYRDFVYNIINNKSLIIKHSYRGSFIRPDLILGNNKLRKKANNQIFADIRDTDNLPHELGHQLDFYFGRNKALTKTVILFDNQTFSQIVKSEFREKKADMFDFIKSKIKEVVDSTLGKGSFDLLDSYMDTYHKLYEDLDKSTRKKIHNELYESGFVETYYRYVISDIPHKLDNKYHPIIDILSSKYDFFGLGLFHHNIDYYIESNRLGFELFANLFAAEVTSKYEMLKNTKKMLPNSYKAFEKLFFIIYDHIQNKKAFSDLETKEIEA